MAFELLWGAEALIRRESNMYKTSRQTYGLTGQRHPIHNERSEAIILILFKAAAGICICQAALNAVLAEKFNTNHNLHI